MWQLRAVNKNLWSENKELSNKWEQKGMHTALLTKSHVNMSAKSIYVCIRWRERQPGSVMLHDLHSLHGAFYHCKTYIINLIVGTNEDHGQEILIALDRVARHFNDVMVNDQATVARIHTSL